MSNAPVARPLATVLSCYLGWTLDAFDFFIVVFTFDNVARTFGVPTSSTATALLLTLAFRPVGAFFFGRAADRYGRKPVLIAAIVAYSIVDLATAAAPTLTVFLALRALFGVALGGEWGVGASLTMESIPAHWRGAVSGLLQTGYPMGYLLASILFLAEPAIGWRGMFVAGALPALLVLFIWRAVEESPDWRARTQAAVPAPGFLEVLRRHAGLAVFAILVMASFNFFSHGSQDLYPKVFLAKERHFPPHLITTIVVLYNLGAIAGGLTFGFLSQRLGRGRTIALAALLSLPVLPLFAFATTPLRIGIAAVLMQFFIQGAWGVVPAYLNELSPPAVRATFPGLTYQLGNLIAAPNATLQLWIAHEYGGGSLSIALVAVLGTAAIALILLPLFGPKRSNLDPPPLAALH